MKANPGLNTYPMRLAVQIKRLFQGTLAQSKFTRYIESIQYLPREELKRLQNIELSKILTHAVNKVPYYKSLKGQLELSPMSAADDIKHFPIITKEIYSNQKSEFIDTEKPVLFSMHSGGTTMTKVSVNFGKNFETHRANEYFNRIAGIYPGISRFVLSRHESTYADDGPGEKAVEFYINRFSKNYHVSPYDFNESKLKTAYEILKKAKPKVLKGSSSALYEFALSIEKNGWVAPEVPVVFSGQSNMQPYYIKTFKRVFNARTYNIYGATESGFVAGQCEQSDGLHYVPVVHFLESLDENGHRVLDKPGRMTITSLTNYAMPIIRYQIGDFVSLTDRNCSCGRSFQMIEKIDGRLYEMINTPKGTHIAVYELKKVLGEYPAIIDFQAVQTAPDTIELRLKCANEKLSADEIPALKSEIIRSMECEMDINVKYIDSLSHLPSGKILRVISQERYEKSVRAGADAGSV